jgi:hypothetical protein
MRPMRRHKESEEVVAYAVCRRGPLQRLLAMFVTHVLSTTFFSSLDTSESRIHRQMTF